MNELPNVYQFLAAGLSADPLLCLAQAVSWLDPFWSDDEPDDYDDDGILRVALHLCRTCLPEIYAQAVEALHQGAEYDDLDRLICTEISALGIPLDCIEGMGYGIPIPAYGAVLHDPEFYTHHPDIVPVVRMFGIQPEDDYPVDVPGQVYAAMHHLMVSLIEHPDEQYRQVGWVMGFLGSCTGNSTVDVDFESLAGFQLLSWEPDEFAFAVEIIREADEIMASVQAGLVLIQSHPHIQSALQDNIQRLYRSFARQSKSKKERKTYDHPRLYWPALDAGSPGTAESNT